MSRVNSQGFRFLEDQYSFLKTVASMAYGTGFKEKRGGGKGNIGLVRDSQGVMHVVKFNTHSNEGGNAQKAIDRDGGLADNVHRQMLSASNALRDELRRIATSLGMPQKEQDSILGGAGNTRSLLTRRVVARFLSEVQPRFISAARVFGNAGKALDDIWSGGAAFASQRDMSFETVTASLSTGILSRKVNIDYSGEEAWALYRAFDALCADGALKQGVVKADVTFGGKNLFLKEDGGTVKYQRTTDGYPSAGEWMDTGVSARDLRSRMFHEVLSGDFSPNARHIFDDMRKRFDHAPASVRLQFRQDSVFYLMARTKFPNDRFAGISTEKLVYLASRVAELDDDADARTYAMAKLSAYAMAEDTGLVTSKDSLALLDASKAEPKPDKVVFEPFPDQERQPKAEASEKFHRLAADLLSLADSSGVDASLASAETEEKLRNERAYVEEQMKILDLTDGELDARPEKKDRHDKLKAKLDAYKKSVKTIPAELLTRRLVRKIRQEQVFGKLVGLKFDAMLAAFNKAKAPQDGVELKVGNEKYDSADGNKIVSAWMSIDGRWLGGKNLQAVPLLEVLRNYCGEQDEYPVKLSLVDPITNAGQDGKFSREGAIDIENARRMLEACEKKTADETRPVKADAERAVLQVLPQLVKGVFFKEDGTPLDTTSLNELLQAITKKKDSVFQTLEVDPQQRSNFSMNGFRLLYRQVLSEWEKERPWDFVESEARELLRRELLSDWAPDAGCVEDTAEAMRIVEAVRQNKDALAELISRGKDANPCPGDSVTNELLAIFAKDDGFCEMLGISEDERTDADHCLAKIEVFLSSPQKADRETIRKLSGQVRAFVSRQLALAQDTLNQLIDRAYGQKPRESDFDPDGIRLSFNHADGVYRAELRIIQEQLNGNSDAVGYGKFLKTALRRYFNEQPLRVRLNLMASRMRLSPDNASPGEQLGALFKGAGPLLQKMLQAFDPLQDPDLKTAIRDVKTNLSPIPQDVLRAHLLDVVNRSGGRIEKISVKKSLGCASVGQTLLCRVEGPGVQSGGLDVVVKVLRPDALNLLRQERDFLVRCAKEAGMGPAYEAIVDKVLEEFDMTLEVKNVEASKVYNGVKEGVQTLTTLPLVEPTPGTLLLQLAPGQTLDGFFQKAEATKNLYADTYGISFGIRLQDNGASYQDSMRAFKRDREMSEKYGYVNADTQRKQFQNIKTKVVELREAHKRLSALTEIWIGQGCTDGGSGFYHGDLHAGNIMIDSEKGVTAIDMGNVSTLGVEEKKGLCDLLGMCNEVPCNQAELSGEPPTVAGDKMPPEWISGTLSLLADRLYGCLYRMMSSIQAGKLKDMYECGQPMVKEVGCNGPVEFTSLKHEFMAILSSESPEPSPFDRLSVLLTRLERRGFELPESISRFLSAALRLKKEVNHLVDLEAGIFGAISGFSTYMIGKTPARFRILGNIFTLYNEKKNEYPHLKDLDKKELDAHLKILKDTIKDGMMDGVNGKERQKIKNDVAWLRNEDINRCLRELEAKYTEKGAEELAQAIYDYEVKEYKKMQTVYAEELDRQKRPSPLKLERFEAIFNRVISNRLDDSRHDA